MKTHIALWKTFELMYAGLIGGIVSYLLIGLIDYKKSIITIILIITTIGIFAFLHYKFRPEE